MRSQLVLAYFRPVRAISSVSLARLRAAAAPSTRAWAWAMERESSSGASTGSMRVSTVSPAFTASPGFKITRCMLPATGAATMWRLRMRVLPSSLTFTVSGPFCTTPVSTSMGRGFKAKATRLITPTKTSSSTSLRSRPRPEGGRLASHGGVVVAGAASLASDMRALLSCTHFATGQVIFACRHASSLFKSAPAQHF